MLKILTHSEKHGSNSQLRMGKY